VRAAMTVWCDDTAPALVGVPAWFSVSALVTVPGRGTVPGRVRLLVADGTAAPDQAGAASALVTMIAGGTPVLAATDKPGVVPVRGVAAASAAACAASAAST
jgi:hypothetical protein